MKVIEILNFNRELLKRLQAAGTRRAQAAFRIARRKRNAGCAYRMAGVYMDKQVSGKVKILTGGNGTTGIHNGPIPKPATRESG